MNTSILFTLRKLGLNPRLGYKVKDQQNNDLAILHVDVYLRAQRLLQGPPWSLDPHVGAVKLDGHAFGEGYGFVSDTRHFLLLKRKT